ncbi:MAG: ComF family protein [Candidatus Vogelbacteria bacterium]|nr:ComF family protein [Candidatus Vogelbacteria bacterium]
MLTFIHRYLLDLFFPQSCLGCGQPKERLCVRCLDELPPQNAQEKGVFSVFDYQTALIKRAIWRLKYKGEKPIALRLGQELYRRGRARLDLPANQHQPLIVIPIPLSRRRLAERGFNQAALIAKALVDCNPSQLRFADDVLVKIKNTAAQVAMKSRAARRANLAGAFAVRNSALVAGQTIILIDDVATTGATMAEAKRTLMSVGAKRVISLTVARG